MALTFQNYCYSQDSKGQSLYGKYITAVGIDEDGVSKRFYFELKGHNDKDISDLILMKPDGIMKFIMLRQV